MDWQIIQQENGKADIYLSGCWILETRIDHMKVLVRIVKEDTGNAVIPWHE